MTVLPKTLALPWSSGRAGPDGRRDPQVLAGEREVAALYAAHQHGLRGFCRRLLGDPEAAEDLVHDVFVALPRALSRYRGEAELGAFLRGMAANQARKHIRAAVRRRRAMDRLAVELEYAADFPPAEVERRVLARQLTAAMDTLPVAQRVAFVLCEVEGLGAAEAGAVVDAPEATMRTRLFHARRKLRAQLGGTP